MGSLRLQLTYGLWSQITDCSDVLFTVFATDDGSVMDEVLSETCIASSKMCAYFLPVGSHVLMYCTGKVLKNVSRIISGMGQSDTMFVVCYTWQTT